MESLNARQFEWSDERSALEGYECVERSAPKRIFVPSWYAECSLEFVNTCTLSIRPTGESVRVSGLVGLVPNQAGGSFDSQESFDCRRTDLADSGLDPSTRKHLAGR